MKKRSTRLTIGLCVVALTWQTAATAADASHLSALARMNLEELSNLEVTSASRVPQRLTEVASAAYVVTAEDIRRSGARSLPEALRLAPSVQVARTGAFGWSISIRGFNGDLSNKLLVLIDGRSVYSPLFAGVFWDVQDYLMEDIERIEVVAGPGGALWGANSVNGVINIITKSAQLTEGGFAQGGAGRTDPLFAGLRFGGQLGERFAGRVYAKYTDRDDVRRLDAAHFDDGKLFQAGFRIDGDMAAGSLTWQGDVYRGDRLSLIARDFTLGTLPGAPGIFSTDLRGANTLVRWETARPESSWTTQLYVDHTERDIPFTYDERRTTADLDLQHRLQFGARHDVLWGAELRVSSDDVSNSSFAAFLPDQRTDWTYSAYLQDRIALSPDRVFATLGTKLEHNNYTGFELQPNIRLSWLPSEAQTIWAAVSRAVRIPSRLDADLQLAAPLRLPGIPVPIYARVEGSHAFDAETLWAYETGWRWQANDRLHLDLATFYNDYDHLQTQEPREPVVVTSPQTYILLPNELTNGKSAHSYGSTLVARWQASTSSQVRLDYSFLRIFAEPASGSRDPTARGVEGDSPRHQGAIESFSNIGSTLSLFVAARYVSALANQRIGAYTTVDASLQWHPAGPLELAVTGRDLLDRAHSEFGTPTRDAIGRTVYATMSLRF